MGFSLKCPMPGCSTEMKAETKEDLLKQGIEHAKTAHGMAMISPNVMAQVQAAIKQTYSDSPVVSLLLSFFLVYLISCESS